MMGKLLYDNYRIAQIRNGQAVPSWDDLDIHNQIVWAELGHFVSAFIRGLIILGVEVP